MTDKLPPHGLQVFKIPGFQRGFLKLINFMNHFRASPATFAFAV